MPPLQTSQNLAPFSSTYFSHFLFNLYRNLPKFFQFSKLCKPGHPPKCCFFIYIQMFIVQEFSLHLCHFTFTYVLFLASFCRRHHFLLHISSFFVSISKFQVETLLQRSIHVLSHTLASSNMGLEFAFV
jgi:hypothetical protein